MDWPSAACLYALQKRPNAIVKTHSKPPIRVTSKRSVMIKRQVSAGQCHFAF
jgi:hypothetical protein